MTNVLISEKIVIVSLLYAHNVKIKTDRNYLQFMTGSNVQIRPAITYKTS